MTDAENLLFQLKNIPLPEASLRLPLRSSAAPADPRTPEDVSPDTLASLLEPIISAAIARKARQRRYTP